MFLAPVCCLAGQPDAPAAKVNGAVITEGEVRNALQAVIPGAVFHRGVSEEKLASFRTKALDSVIELELLYQEAIRRGIKPDAKIVKDTVEMARKQAGGKKKFNDALKKEGIDEKQFAKRIEKRDVVNNLIRTEVVAKAAVTKEEVRAYYDRNMTNYMVAETRALSHILIAVSPNATNDGKELLRERAAEALRKLKEGEDFATIAWDYSNDPYRVVGGSMGPIHKGRLEPAIEETAFRLQKGALSDIIETIYGFHIVRVDDIKEPVQLSFEEVSKAIEKSLVDNKIVSLRESLVISLRSKAAIEIY